MSQGNVPNLNIYFYNQCKVTHQGYATIFQITQKRIQTLEALQSQYQAVRVQSVTQLKSPELSEGEYLANKVLPANPLEENGNQTIDDIRTTSVEKNANQSLDDIRVTSVEENGKQPFDDIGATLKEKYGNQSSEIIAANPLEKNGNQSLVDKGAISVKESSNNYEREEIIGDYIQEGKTTSYEDPVDGNTQTEEKIHEPLPKLVIDELKDVMVKKCHDDIGRRTPSIQNLDMNESMSSRVQESMDRLNNDALGTDEFDAIKSVDTESSGIITTAQIHSPPKDTRKKRSRKKYPAPDPNPVVHNPPQIDDDTNEVEASTKTSNYNVRALIITGVVLLLLIIIAIVLILMTSRSSSPSFSLQNITISKKYNEYATQHSFDLLMMFGGNREPNTFDIITKSNGNCIFPIEYMAHLPFKRVGYSIIFHKSSNSLILCGGVDSSRVDSNECWKYKRGFNGNKWSRISGYMPSRFSYGAITILHEKLYVIGGFSHGKEMVDTQVMDLRTEVWSREENLPYPLWGHCAVTIKKNIYIIGGWTISSEKRSVVLKDVVKFESTKSWEKVKEIRTPRATHACFPTKFNRKYVILIAGGMDSYQQPINSVEAIFWNKGQQTLVSSLGNMIEARMRYPGIGIIERKWIVVAGGEGSSQSVEYYDFKKKEWKMSLRNKLSTERINGASAIVPSNWFNQCLPK
ncbi:uncharacterized protein [Lepeophtheirus salmonis]|uniref:uncharacterized protein isoform X2 n=1 Tax=Lepeophtheirus salmonis TaxID=72036 RepID=UPI001AE7310E|nr:uncharacterized protein LOC121118384 isoform X2 [Lepeophtheirus salmonis]